MLGLGAIAWWFKRAVDREVDGWMRDLTAAQRAGGTQGQRPRTGQESIARAHKSVDKL